MTGPTPQRPSRPTDARPVMGDHPELETDETQRTALTPDRGGRSSLLVPGIILLVIVVVVIAVVILAA
jgi:hypothetical protein